MASTRRSIPLLAGITFPRPCCLVPDRARIRFEPLALFVTAVTPAGLLAQPMEKNGRQQRLRWWSFKAVVAKQEDSGRERAGDFSDDFTIDCSQHPPPQHPPPSDCLRISIFSGSLLHIFTFIAANMSNVEAINLSGDEGAVEISKPSVAAASGSKAAPGNTQRKVKPNTGITKRRQRKLTSPVWDYFTILDDTNEKGDLLCLCNRCGVKYIAESRHGTGNMLRHGKSFNLRLLDLRDI
ncbi:hypothetical protein LXL04_030260 [Taraxacum kok-saghyz]